MRKIIFGGALALAAASPAFAATTIIPQDNSSPGPTLVFTSGVAVATFGASYTVDNEQFTDSFFFNLGQSANLTAGTLLTQAGGNEAPFKGDLDIEFVNVLSGATTLFTLAKTTTPGETDKNEMFSVPNSNLNQLFAAGNYSVVIRGFADNVSPSVARGGAGPGTYNGSLTFAAAAAPVPEPGTWAMMLLGFGAVGFGLRRRRSQNLSKVRVRFAI